MLILTRRVGESLIIGDDIVINILGVKGNQIRIGVNAPEGNFRSSRRDLQSNSSRKSRRQKHRLKSKYFTSQPVKT